MTFEVLFLEREVAKNLSIRHIQVLSLGPANDSMLLAPSCHIYEINLVITKESFESKVSNLYMGLDRRL